MLTRNPNSSVPLPLSCNRVQFFRTQLSPANRGAWLYVSAGFHLCTPAHGGKSVGFVRMRFPFSNCRLVTASRTIASSRIPLLCVQFGYNYEGVYGVVNVSNCFNLIRFDQYLVTAAAISLTQRLRIRSWSCFTGTWHPRLVRDSCNSWPSLQHDSHVNHWLKYEFCLFLIDLYESRDFNYHITALSLLAFGFPGETKENNRIPSLVRVTGLRPSFKQEILE